MIKEVPRRVQRKRGAIAARDISHKTIVAMHDHPEIWDNERPKYSNRVKKRLKWEKVY